MSAFLVFFISAAFLILSTRLEAVPFYLPSEKNIETLNPRYQPPEEETSTLPDPVMSVESDLYFNDPPKRKNSSYFFKQEGISLWGSFIYWQPRQDFMDIALKSCCQFNCPTKASGGTSWRNARRIEIKPDYQSGFKVGIEVAPLNWGLFADYTYFNFEGSRSVTLPLTSDGFIFARWILPGVVLNNSAEHVNTKWSGKLEVVNVEAGRRCYWGRRFMLKPHFGIAVAWIDQKLKGRFLLISPTLNFLKMRHQSDSWGIGPRAGVDVELRFFKGLGLVGTVATDILYTRYDLELHASSPNPELFSAIFSHPDTLRLELELYCGINACFKVTKKTAMNLQVGYDSQVWFNQNMMRWNNDTGWTASPEGNLYLSGLRATLKLDF